MTIAIIVAYDDHQGEQEVKDSQEDSSFPANGHQGEQEVGESQKDRPFPADGHQGEQEVENSHEDSSFPADGHQGEQEVDGKQNKLTGYSIDDIDYLTIRCRVKTVKRYSVEG